MAHGSSSLILLLFARFLFLSSYYFSCCAFFVCDEIQNTSSRKIAHVARQSTPPQPVLLVCLNLLERPNSRVRISDAQDATIVVATVVSSFQITILPAFGPARGVPTDTNGTFKTPFRGIGWYQVCPRLDAQASRLLKDYYFIRTLETTEWKMRQATWIA